MTDQSPPRHLIPTSEEKVKPTFADAEEQDGHAGQDQSEYGEGVVASSRDPPLALTDQLLALTDEPVTADKVRQLDANTGSRIGFDELGPMVVSEEM